MSQATYKSNRPALSSAGMSGLQAMIMQMPAPLAHAMTMAFVVGVIFGFGVHSVVGGSWIFIATFVLVAAVETALCVRSFKRFSREIATRGLGVLGERIMATHLAELGRDGHIVVHDLPLANMNIDHVLIGPKGVIVIETKMRRKVEGKSGKIRVENEAIVINDGRPDPGPINQVRKAMSLLGEKLRIPPELLRGVVVYPEWWVDDWASDGVRVSNDKMLFTHIRELKDRMSRDEIDHYYNLLKNIFDAELRASAAQEA